MQRGDQTLLRRVGVRGPEAPVLDVVFVHGLGGDGTTTWMAHGATESWLDWLGHDIRSIAVWSLSYPAGATKWTTEGEGMALADRAANLIDTMLYYGIGTDASRRFRRLPILGGSELWDVSAGTPTSFVSVRCAWSLRCVRSTPRSGRRSPRWRACWGSAHRRRCGPGSAARKSIPASGRGGT